MHKQIRVCINLLCRLLRNSLWIKKSDAILIIFCQQKVGLIIFKKGAYTQDQQLVARKKKQDQRIFSRTFTFRSTERRGTSARVAVAARHTCTAIATIYTVTNTVVHL